MKSKSFLLLCVLFAANALFVGCKGTEGPQGPKGETGENGPQGPAGPQGPMGNANVIQLTYGSRVHNGDELTYNLTGVTINQVNASAFFAYVNVGGFWYALPGNVSSAFTYRSYARASGTPQYFIVRLTGSGNHRFESTRIVIIPASDLRSGRLASINYKDYQAVREYYNLPD